MLISFVWSLVICAAVLMVVSKNMSGVRCESFQDALKTAFLYAVFTAILTRILAIPMIASTALFGVATMGLGFFILPVFWGLLICGISLFFADKIIEGFEIESFSTTVLVCIVVGMGNLLARVLHIL